MHQAFQILPTEVNPSQTNFFGEVGNSGLSFFLQDNEDKTITGLCVFNFNNIRGEINIASVLGEIFLKEEILKNKFNKVFISYANNESILTPALYYSGQKEEDLNLLFGDLYHATTLTDHIATRNLYNTYRVHAGVHRQILSRFQEPSFIHQYSLILMQLQQMPNLLEVIFYQHNFVLVLQKEGNLQIIQSFHYVTAADVVYHMLNVCKQFNAIELNVQLCGMIEKDSALFKEIRKYFSTVTFAGLPPSLLYSDEILQLPPHFFSHLFSFALCV